jgi:transcriptional regulator with XRE-family HTH domain
VSQEPSRATGAGGTGHAEDAAQGGPTVSRIMLGTQLRRLREAAGISRHRAGDHIRASHAKISRLELGRVGVKERDLRDLLTLYGVDDPRERAALLGMVAPANARGWWQQDSDLLPTWFEMYLRLEQEARYIRCFQVQFVPGLLQTEEYARRVILAGHGAESAYEVDRRVQLRMNRQKMLAEPGGPQFWAVIDEGALRRPFGPPDVMRGQLEHILAVSAMPNVTVQVLPFTAGSHAAAGGPFTVLRFAEPDLPDVVYLEQLNSAVYVDKREDVEDYLGVIEQVSVQALTPAQTRTAIAELAASW